MRSLPSVCLAIALCCTAATASAQDEVRLSRDPHTLLFMVPVTIGSKTIDMVVDTGASLTILTPQDAARFGAALTLNGRVVGAGITGVAEMPTIRASNVVVAGRRLGSRTMVVGHGGIGVSLLGQAELRSLGDITIRGDVMTIATTRERPDAAR